MGQARDIQPADSSDRSIIRGLLFEARLPVEDLDLAARVTFFVARNNGQPVGAIGLERYGNTALLRSLVVAPDHRRRGLGTLRPAPPPRAHPHPPARARAPSQRPRTPAGLVVTHQYAVEMVLTRPATVRELHQARHRVTFAANADRTRLMTVQRGKGPGAGAGAGVHRTA